MRISEHSKKKSSLTQKFYTKINYGAWVIYEPWFTGSHTLCEPCPLGDPKKKK
jgi:hypothetical protein